MELETKQCAVTRLPLWLKALLQVRFMASAVARGIGAAYNVAVRYCVPRELRDATNAYIYDRSASYKAGGKFGTGGYFDHMFPWEKELVRVFPQGGRLLLGAAGSGRELHWLGTHGFKVVAFEPSALVTLARERVASANGHVALFQASYNDLVDGVFSHAGPMADVLREGPFDGVILGWGSLSHVWDSAERSRLFLALKKHSPNAPIVASFLCRKDENSSRKSDVTFIGGHGFCHLFAQREVHHLALDHGYVLDRYDTQPYPHALFLPLQHPSH